MRANILVACLLCTSVFGAAPVQAPPAKIKLAQPVLFNTPESDAILSAMRIFPPDSAWHEDISQRPVRANSERMIANIGAGKRLGWNFDMGFVLVPPNQPRVNVKLVSYPDESDPGPYPVPDNTPIEGWPHGLEKTETLEHVQRVGEGDRHAIVVDPAGGKLYEFYQMRRTDAGWQASNAAIFDLLSNKLRPPGWTSSDAAGLPIFPAIVRYDECERGVVDHAIRVTVERSRKAYLYPATHQAGHTTDPDFPAMGERFRLKANVDISAFPKQAKALALAMKKYGLIVADNGMSWLISVAPDPRIRANDLEVLRKLHGSDFEVIETTKENEGPRAGRAGK